MFLARAIKAKSYKDWRKPPRAQLCEHSCPDHVLACSDNIVCWGWHSVQVKSQEEKLPTLRNLNGHIHSSSSAYCPSPRSTQLALLCRRGYAALPGFLPLCWGGAGSQVAIVFPQKHCYSKYLLIPAVRKDSEPLLARINIAPTSICVSTHLSSTVLRRF